jgi:hypothetical protein
MPGISLANLSSVLKEHDLPAQKHSQVDVGPRLLLGDEVVRAEAQIAHHRGREHYVEPVYERVPVPSVFGHRLHQSRDRIHEKADRPGELMRLASV